MTDSRPSFDLEVVVDGRTHRPDPQGYLPLPHQTEYQLRLANRHSTQCDATVTIDGVQVGVWRISPYSSIEIERPADRPQRFTFLEEDSEQAAQARVRSGHWQNGLVEVLFRPEKKVEPDLDFEMDTHGFDFPVFRSFRDFDRSQPSLESDFRGGGASRGATAYGRISGQTFTPASPLGPVDRMMITTRRLRLVCRPKYRAVNPEPYADPVPPPL